MEKKVYMELSVLNRHYLRVVITGSNNLEFTDLIPIKGIGMRSVVDDDNIMLSFSSNGMLFEYPKLSKKDILSINEKGVETYLATLDKLHNYITQYNTKVING